MKPNHPLREAAVVAEYEIRAMLLSVRSIFLGVIYGGAVFSALKLVLVLWRQAKEQIAQKAAEQGSLLDPETIVKSAIESDQFKTWMNEEVLVAARKLGTEVGYVADALNDGTLPWALAVALIVTATVVPPLLLLISYDRVSADLSSRFTRFVLQRVRRGSYLAGKVAGQFVVVSGVLIAVSLILVGAATTVPEIEVGPLVAHLPKLWLGFSVVTLAYLSLFTLISVSFRRPFVALLMGGFIHFVLGVLALASEDFGMVWIGRWDYRMTLLNLPAIGVGLAHVVVFGGLAYALLRRRDV